MTRESGRRRRVRHDAPWPKSWQRDTPPGPPIVEVELAPGTTFRLSVDDLAPERVEIVDVLPTDDPDRPVVVEGPASGRVAMIPADGAPWLRPDPSRSLQATKTKVSVLDVGRGGVAPSDRSGWVFFDAPERRRTPEEEARHDAPWPRSWEWDSPPAEPFVEIDLAPGAAFSLSIETVPPERVEIVEVLSTGDPSRPVVVVEGPTHGRVGIVPADGRPWLQPAPPRTLQKTGTHVAVARAPEPGSTAFDRKGYVLFDVPEHRSTTEDPPRPGAVDHDADARRGMPDTTETRPR